MRHLIPWSRGHTDTLSRGNTNKDYVTVRETASHSWVKTTRHYVRCCTIGRPYPRTKTSWWYEAHNVQNVPVVRHSVKHWLGRVIEGTICGAGKPVHEWRSIIYPFADNLSDHDLLTQFWLNQTRVWYCTLERNSKMLFSSGRTLKGMIHSSSVNFFHEAKSSIVWVQRWNDVDARRN